MFTFEGERSPYINSSYTPPPWNKHVIAPLPPPPSPASSLACARPSSSIDDRKRGPAVAQRAAGPSLLTASHTCLTSLLTPPEHMLSHHRDEKNDQENKWGRTLINQSIRMSTDRSSIKQSINQSTHQSINQSLISINKLINHSISPDTRCTLPHEQNLYGPNLAESNRFEPNRTEPNRTKPN